MVPHLAQCRLSPVHRFMAWVQFLGVLVRLYFGQTPANHATPIGIRGPLDLKSRRRHRPPRRHRVTQLTSCNKPLCITGIQLEQHRYRLHRSTMRLEIPAQCHQPREPRRAVRGRLAGQMHTTNGGGHTRRLLARAHLYDHESASRPKRASRSRCPTPMTVPPGSDSPTQPRWPKYQASRDTPTGRVASSVCFTSNAMFLPATRRRWFIFARFILASCHAATPDGSACRK